jgi:CDP-diacylglycerol---glycerol-3-phosphate 3-phosphatidyltransferase
MTQGKSTRHFNTLTDRVRYYTSGLTTRLGTWLYNKGVHPDAITAFGLVIVAIASVVIAQGHFVAGGLILLMGTPLDAIDGAVARAMQRKDRFGALFDSTLDRYADGFIFMGLAYYYSGQGNQNVMLLSILALLGSLLVSYVRARAEGLNLDCKVGLLTRMERVFIILVMLIVGLVVPGLWILVIGTHMTVIQRVWHVYRAIRKQQGDNSR